MEYQWGVRTVYTDDSHGVDWTNEDDAVSFLTYYAECDAEPALRVRFRELVRRPIDPGQIEVVGSRYAERRQARRAPCRAARETGVLLLRAAGRPARHRRPLRALRGQPHTRHA